MVYLLRSFRFSIESDSQQPSLEAGTRLHEAPALRLSGPRGVENAFAQLEHRRVRRVKDRAGHVVLRHRAMNDDVGYV